MGTCWLQILKSSNGHRASPLVTEVPQSNCFLLWREFPTITQTTRSVVTWLIEEALVFRGFIFHPLNHVPTKTSNVIALFGSLWSINIMSIRWTNVIFCEKARESRAFCNGGWKRRQVTVQIYSVASPYQLSQTRFWTSFLIGKNNAFARSIAWMLSGHDHWPYLGRKQILRSSWGQEVGICEQPGLVLPFSRRPVMVLTSSSEWGLL